MRRPLLVLFAGLVVWGGSVAAVQAAPTIVTLGFDDGLVTQYENRALLSSRGLAATYYINSGKLGQPRYMTWSQVAAMAAEGHEIGGHTLTHARLPSLLAAAQRTEICDDRTALVARGFPALSFAYPFGADDASSNAIAQSCGYLSARTTRGIDWPTCDVCAELIPPRNAYSSRALQANASVTAADLQIAVQNTLNTGGGWLQLVFHDVCDGCDDYGIPAPTFAAFFDWLVAQRTAGTLVVRTAAQVMQGTTPPPPPDTTAPTVDLTAPANGTVVTNPQSPLALTATAADAGGVARVEFLVNGAVVGTDTTAPYDTSFVPATVGGTSLTVAARAVDTAANTATSASSTVQVTSPDTVKPTVTLTAPLNNATLTNPVTIKATASDDVVVTAVRFLIDGVVRLTDTTAPYSVTGSLTRGTRTFAVEAVDAAGNTARAATITVRIR
jgi:peptidoglycan/xylan/chitin deacetylase (PgdA/CDA1 family)